MRHRFYTDVGTSPNICKIRKCGKQKQVENCAYCHEYACEKLTKFFAMAPDAK
ncbi:MAG: DUF3795 domain-containing protein, partial [Chloroflexi bacterium]|nr:DUF3795 domain-containing protein [Chloroflexota bacterium]